MKEARRFSVRHAAALVLAGLLLWLLSDVFLLAFAAILVAIALCGGGAWIARHTGRSRRTGVILLTGCLLLATIATGVFTGPRLVEQGNQLWDQILEAVAYAQTRLETYSWGQALLEKASPEQLAEDGQRVVRVVGLSLMALLTALGSLALVLVTALFLAWSPELYTRGLLRLLPVARRERGMEVLCAVGERLRRWMFGQGIAMAAIAVTAYAGLALIGVPLAPLLALIAGLTNVVPYVGPIAGAVPALIVALGEGPQVAAWVALLFVGIQFVEGNFLEPVVQKIASSLPPALTILSQTLMGSLFGVLGVILATPVLAASLVAVRMLYVEDLLERDAHSDSHSEPELEKGAPRKRPLAVRRRA